MGGVKIESDNTFIQVSDNPKVHGISNENISFSDSTNTTNRNFDGLGMIIFIIVAIFMAIILAKAPILWLVVALWLFCK